MSEPVVPLALTKQETEILRIAVETMLKLDGSVLQDTELQKIAERQISEQQGPLGVARVDQALAAARDRLPILRSLHAALVEHEENWHGSAKRID